MGKAENDTMQGNAPVTGKGTQPAERRSPTWSAEAFSIAAVVLGGASLLGTRLVQTLAGATATGGQVGGQLSFVTRTIVGDGTTAVVGAVLALLALFTANAETRPWARWLAAATLVLSAIAVIVSVVAFFLLPQPQPQPPVPGFP